MRYSRQEILIGKKGQEKLSDSCIAIVGIGALGSVSSELLTRAGIKKLILIDRDVIELNNLQRQTMYSEEDIGKAKAIRAKKHLEEINSEVNIESHTVDLDYKNINLLKEADLILDGTDNLETRYLINEFAVKNNKPWIYASGVKDKGYIFNIRDKPCLNCFLDNAKALGSCDTLGVLNTLTNFVGSIQVNEAIKILLGQKHEENLLHININKNEIKKIKVKPNKDCRVCKGNFEYLEGKKQEQLIKFCGTYTYQIKNGKIDLKEIKSKLKKLGEVKDLGYAVKFKKLTIFNNRAIIKAESKEEAKSLYSKYIGN